MNVNPRTSLEDVLGMQEYSLQNSVRLINHNPDMMNINFVSCSCGEIIDRAKDWHVMIANGTLLCRGCARCSSCRSESAWRDKRLVCIDGLTLCHPCLVNFGHFIEPAYTIKIDDPNGRMELPPGNDNNVQEDDNGTKESVNTAKESDNAAKDAKSNVKEDNSTHKTENNTRRGNERDASDVLMEYNRKDRSCYKVQKDKRRPIRRAFYDPQSARLPDKVNPLITAPVYDAVKGPLDQMTCPSCSEVARGSRRYVVPSMARVYHKTCFSCHSCKVGMSSGVQLPGKQFEYCTCDQPLVWCTRDGCKQQRLEHHASTGKCWLGALRPGGRYQFDTDISAEAAKQAAAAKERQSKAKEGE